MQIGPRVELKQSQQLVMTPQLQQAIRLLQMSRLDTVDYLAQEVEKNPVLAIDDGGEMASSADTAREEAIDRAIARQDIGEAENGFETGRENLYEAAESYSVGGPSGAMSGGGTGRDGALADAGAQADFEETAAQKISLRDHLLPQIGASAAPRGTRALAALLVDELDEAGYLRVDIEALGARLGAHSGLAAEAVALLQSCEPTGIGARDLKECLTLQLKERDRFDPAMATLIDRLDDLAAARLAPLRAACGVDEEDLREMIAEIRRLEPRPGAAFTTGVAASVVPEVLIRRNTLGGWTVEVNPDAMPKVLLDTAYVNELGASGSVEVKAYLTTCRQNADWLIRALEQRAQTILKVATEIVRRQSGFFEQGVAALSPMTLKLVADEIGMHESTVSRVTANKFLACERGVFELKFFFTQGIASVDGGGAVSAAAVRHQIKSLIEKEDPSRSLSDDRIVTLLKQSGVDVARRTVAKYRETMNIPSSAQRKRMKAAALGR
ncbi:RNA polymerase factor sigma-54 [Pikeienuella piscinae]|uniref:RNA polymerase sigma-54 factor n=1 Tax=Pikeienuella piscinae TaxID=2748098 RepID=A0A7L5BUI2_9RHOB|nr:RNA polymerase factor sigma-54 [Pikeienuella piscinae]QIE54358.1 RNA polymerase factor sigma-54 [Pikeienuella piscinae]